MSTYHDDKVVDEERSPFLATTRQLARATPSRSGIYWYCSALVIGISILLNVIWLAQCWSQASSLDTVCNDYTSQSHSPISDEIDITYDTVKFDGSFWNESIYTRAPSKEVEEAWGALGSDLRHHVIPEDQAERYGLDPGHLKLKPEQGGGFPVMFEFHHHLHCLNLLRKTSYFNFEHYNATQIEGFQDGEAMVRKHIGHCINQLRQVIMCQPDLGVFGQIWVDPINKPFVNFNNKHKCKNYDAIKQKAIGLQVPKDEKLIVRLQDGDIRVAEIP